MLRAKEGEHGNIPQAKFIVRCNLPALAFESAFRAAFKLKVIYERY